MTSCCISSCKNQNCKEESGVTFFDFPKEKGRRRKWITAVQTHLKESSWLPQNDSKICNVHFVTGQPQSNEWHPDYIPSVFRSLRTIRNKVTPFEFDEDEVKKSKNTIVRRTPVVPKPKPSLPLIPARRSKPKIQKIETLRSLSPSSDSFEEVDLTTPRKRKFNEIDSSSEPQLKNLSVVLERTNMKKMKYDDYDIRNEVAEEYYEYPLNSFKETPYKKDKSFKESPYTESPYKEPYRESPYKDPPEKECKKCETLQARLRASGKECRRCPVLEHKLKKAEAEIDQMLEEKFNKCEKCIALEAKCKRIENNLRRTQSEVTNLQTKLSSVELTEEAFKKSKNKVRLYTGLPNYETLSTIFDHVKSKFPTVEVRMLSRFQMFTIVLMKLKLNLPVWDLTFRYGASPNIIQAFYPQYLSVIEANLHHVVLWPNANLRYRLSVLANNVIQNFASVPSEFDIDVIIEPDGKNMPEQDKELRICAAIYHIAQLVTSNHSDQLHRLLNNKSELDKSVKPTEQKETSEKEKSDNEQSQPQLVNGNEDVDDSDIFFEDLTKDITLSGSTKVSFELECKNLKKELDTLNGRLNTQFRFYTGMRNYDVFKNLLSFLTTFSSHIPHEKLTYFQQLHMVLLRLKLNLDVRDLSYMFKVDVDHIVYLTKHWVELMSQKLSRYIDWPAGIEDADGEKKLLGTVKLKYHILWGPQLATRNKKTGMNREKINMKKLIRACAALYNIDDIEVFKDGKATQENEGSTDDKSDEVWEKECRELRNSLYDLRKISMSSICSFFSEESFKLNNEMVSYYTGFHNYEALLNVFNSVSTSISKQDRKNSITPFQHFLFILIRLKLNFSTQDIGMRFGMCQSNVHKLLQDWLLLLHSHLAPYISWPDDEGDAELFTNILWKTYAHLRASNPKSRDQNPESGIFDIPTQVCAGLYNMSGLVYHEPSDSEFDSFDDDW